jgi:hypothetical protein
MKTWLPAASRDAHGKTLTRATTAHPKGVIHTTEGVSWPSYSGWTIHPHATVKPIPGKGVEIRQHVPADHASFALRHTRATETNRANAFQVELIGTSDPGSIKGAYDWTNPDDAVLKDLYETLFVPAHELFGIPLRSTVTWVKYPDSYGNTKSRLSDSEWLKYSGWLGHQHVPQNLHGDPGHFPWARISAMEDDLPLTDSDVKRIADAVAKRVLTIDGIIAAPAEDAKANEHWQLQSYIKAIYAKVAAIAAKDGVK